MGIEAAAASVNSTVSTQSANNTSLSSRANSSDTSFKEEMSKVDNADKKETDTKQKDLKDVKSDKKSDSKSEKNNILKTDSEHKSVVQNDEMNKLQGMLNAQISLNDANMKLSNDIQQMIQNTTEINEANLKNWTISSGTSATSSIKMNESDADFFINLTQTDNVNIQGITSQAQGMINQGAEVTDVKQNVQVSQALLNALSEARESNQPLRIDFDQNISVILRVGKDGAISAQFIPGDKAVEQYLRNNLDSLKSSFDEQDLPYSELSYSHSSKDQNKRRREEKQQGE